MEACSVFFHMSQRKIAIQIYAYLFNAFIFILFYIVKALIVVLFNVSLLLTCQVYQENGNIHCRATWTDL